MANNEKRKKAEKDILDFISTDLPSKELENVGKLRASAVNSRNKLLQGELPRISERISAKYGLPSVPASISPNATRGLDRSLTQIESERTRRDSMAKLNRKFNFVFQNLIDKGFDLESAKNNARQIALQDEQRGFISAESEKERQSILEKEKIADLYAKLGIDVEGGLESGTSLSSALTRALLGTGSTVATGLLLSRLNTPKKDIVPTRTNLSMNTAGVNVGYNPYFDLPVTRTSTNRIAGVGG